MSSKLLEHLAAWKRARIVVVGDMMLDELVYGDAERLSADAPVPVLHVRDTQHRAGGAANVCLNLEALRCEVHALGVVGDDDSGAALCGLLREAGVDGEGMVVDAGRPTTMKRSLIGLAQHRHPQKMFRMDYESREPISAEVRSRLLARLAEVLPGTGVVCVEDYNKGVCDGATCRAVIDMCREAGVPVLVDPARIERYSPRYKGATAITPNRTEAELATGLVCDEHGPGEQAAAMARAMMDDLDLDVVVLTLDRHGALLLERGGEPTPVPTVARSVYDVSGAGDMVLAGLAAARANGASWQDAVRFANAAAGIEVEIFGVEPIPLERIHHDLLIAEGKLTGKVSTVEQLKVQLDALRGPNATIVFTNGCFDVIHTGHVSLLDKAAAKGTFLVVGLNDDESVRRLKGEGRPVNNQDERARVLAALEAVDAVVLFGEDTPIRLIENLRPDVLVKGADYTREGVVGGDLVESYGGRVELVELVEGKSTTAVIERMRGG
jgi:D-beta-D-heptose 7-phosphate kinase/D-beta-D-heptose 1-phosphate adenosyltransferase